ncbi:hypothetical protein [Calothrix sp. PCC 7507]|uniref:hypothetical protein n=1 Tax=Calothrix sp. PCC 7507 TaxID=99598 RepID=UPI0005A8D5E8|nr:hypothetical protein [Calothrix sp. PCC 7507]
MSDFNKVKLAALGKGTSTGATYTVYAFASRGGVWGIYQSTDLGATWNLIDIGSVKIGNDPNCMGASLQVFGDVFVGSGGSGVYYASINT